MRRLGYGLAGAATAASLLLAHPGAAWASHRVAGDAAWEIPWYATAMLMATPYLILAAVGYAVYRLLRPRVEE